MFQRDEGGGEGLRRLSSTLDPLRSDARRERARTRPIEQAARACKLALESTGLSGSPGYDVEASYRQEEETVKITFDGWRSEVVVFSRNGPNFELLPESAEKSGGKLHECIVEEWERVRAGYS